MKRTRSQQQKCSNMRRRKSKSLHLYSFSGWTKSRTAKDSVPKANWANAKGYKNKSLHLYSATADKPAVFVQCFCLNIADN